MTRIMTGVAVLLWLGAAALADDKTAGTEPAAEQYNIGMDRDYFDLYPCGSKLYFHSFPKVAKPPPGVRMSLIPTVHCLDTKTGKVVNLLSYLPVQCDVATTLAYGLVVSPDRKSAILCVDSSVFPAAAGVYMVDLVKQKGAKMLPLLPPNRCFPGWLGKTLVMPDFGDYQMTQTTKQVQGRNGPMYEVGNTVTGHIGQPKCFDVTGAQLQPLPVFGLPVAMSGTGDRFIVQADPKALNKPVAAADFGQVAKVLLMTPKGKVISELPLGGARTNFYSPNLKFAAAQYAYMTVAKRSTDMCVFSLDGKTEYRIPEIVKCYWLSDTGQFVGITVLDHVLEYWDASGKKVWSVQNVMSAAADDGKVYYVTMDDSKTIYVKPLGK